MSLNGLYIYCTLTCDDCSATIEVKVFVREESIGLGWQSAAGYSELSEEVLMRSRSEIPDGWTNPYGFSKHYCPACSDAKKSKETTNVKDED
jgi:hypothetical protein